jgi:serine protease inhibitor
MKKRLSLSIALLTCLGFLPGVRPSPANIEPGTETDLNFGLGMFNSMCDKAKNSNVVFSPSSAYTILALATHGAAGATQQELLKALHAGPDLDDKIASIYTNLKTQKPSVTLTTANGIFVDKRFPVLPEYIKFAKERYRADVENDDFKGPIVQKVNAWCSKNTQGKIPKIMQSAPAGASVVLINALYFKGSWQFPFAEDRTKPGTFHASTGDVQVPMMHSGPSTTPFMNGRNFQAVKLPYKSWQVAMYVFLPSEQTTLKELREEMTPENWKLWMPKFEDNLVNLTMPKFKLATSTQLNDALESQGVSLAFQEEANFSRMSKVHLHITNVIQKTYIDVNEKGTEAAAATEVEMSKDMMPEQIQKVVLDRPFLFALVDNHTNQMLFLGAMNNPAK